MPSTPSPAILDDIIVTIWPAASSAMACWICSRFRRTSALAGSPTDELEPLGIGPW